MSLKAVYITQVLSLDKALSHAYGNSHDHRKPMIFIMCWYVYNVYYAGLYLANTYVLK